MAPPRELALLHTTPTQARAVRAVRDGASFQIAATAEATGSSAPEAAARALDQLDPQRRLPVHAITRDVTASCLELPPTADALPEPRLRELVRWEIEPFLPGEGETKCAWAERRTSANGKSQRLAVGVRRPAIEAWRAALGDRDLVALYPAWVCALATIEGEEPAVLVEVEPDAIGCLRLQGATVESVRVRDRVANDEPALQIFDIVGPPPATVWLGGSGGAAVREALEKNNYSVKTLAEDAPIQGALRHAFGLDGGERIGAVAAKEPAAALHRRPWVLAGAAGLALLLGVAGWAFALGRSVRACDARIAALEVESRRRPDGVPAVVESKPALQADVEKLEKESKALAATRARIEDDVLAHEKRALALLDALGAEANDDVSVDACRESKPGEWHVVGFGLTDEAVQRFHAGLGRALATDGLRATLQGVRADRGRLGVSGWRFELVVSVAGGKS